MRVKSWFYDRNMGKRILFLLCVVAINIIEFTKSALGGDVWYITSNLTGLPVFVMIAATYRKEELVNLFNGIWTGCVLAVMGLVYFYHITYPENYFHLGKVESAISNVWWIVMAARVWYLRRRAAGRTVRQSLRETKFSTWLWIGLMVWMLLAINEAIWPLWFLLMFGLFYTTEYSGEDRKALWDALLNGTILSFCMFQLFAFAFRPFDVVRYSGFYENCNTTAAYYMVVYALVLAKLHVLHMQKASWWRKLFYLLMAAALLVLQLMTMCRTSWIGSAVVTLVYGIVVVGYLWRKWGQIIWRAMVLGILTLVLFLPIFLAARWLPTLSHYRVWYPAEYSPYKVHSYDPPNSEKYIELDEFLEALLGRIGGSLEKLGIKDPFVISSEAATEWKPQETDVVITEEEKGVNGLISGRLWYYKAYLQDTTWIGNTSDKGYYNYMGTGNIVYHAQNLWIQIGYYFGWSAMILLGILTVAVIVMSGKKVSAARSNPYAVVPLLVAIVYFTFGLMEVVWNPGQLILFLIFFVQHPQMGMREEPLIETEQDEDGRRDL